MSISVAFFEELDLPASQVLDATVAVLEELDARGPDLLVLGVRSARVQTQLHAHPRPTRFECTIELAAGHHPKLSPVFRGDLIISPLREYGCEMCLQGSYDVPLGSTDEARDAAVLHGTAARSLGGFLTWLARQAERNVRADPIPDALHCP